MHDLQQPFRLLAADLSLKRPGFALLQVQPEGTIHLEQVLHLDNSKCKTHEEALARIYSMVFTLARHADCYVRERGFSRFQTGTQTLFKVVGVSDLALWAEKQSVFDEIPPASVKKIITGKGTATKEEVAAALIPYVGEHEYACDDESDSVAVGVAWLMLRELMPAVC